MVRLTGAFVALALVATPACACHNFAVWRYPWPQPCGAGYRPNVEAKPTLPLTRAQAATLTDDEQRRMGLDALRPLLDEFVNKRERE